MDLGAFQKSVIEKVKSQLKEQEREELKESRTAKFQELLSQGHDISKAAEILVQWEKDNKK